MKHNLKSDTNYIKKLVYNLKIAIKIKTNTRFYAFTLISSFSSPTNKTLGSQCFYLCVSKCNIHKIFKYVYYDQDKVVKQ